MSVQSEKPEPSGSESKEIRCGSPPRVTHTHCKHLADYMCIFMDGGEEMRMGEDWAAPLVMETLQKICLASHIRHMADLLHTDAIQQLEVALLGMPTSQVIEVLAGGVTSSSST